MSTRINKAEMSTRCFRTDHNQARLINAAREAADEKHSEQSIEHIGAHDVGKWMPILMEEVGEVAHVLTYDSGGSKGDLANELVDVMAVCGAWLDALRQEGVLPTTTAWLA